MDTFQDDLKTKGYAIIPNVITEEECTSLANGFWKFWDTITDGKIQRNDAKSWKKIYDYFPTHGMLVQHFSIGHMQEIWNLRCNENILGVFEKIWKTKDLTVSFDGASTGFAPEETGRGWHLKDWLHLDQSPHRNGFECVQSWITPDKVEEGDGTLMVIEGSHNYHGAFAKKFKLDKDPKYKANWFKLEQEHVNWYLEQDGCKIATIQCPKGSMVLWESRTVHAGRGPVKGRPCPKNRMVAYICMMPTSLLGEKERAKKKAALLQGRHTSHWAAQHVKLFPKIPRTYGAALPDPKPFQPPQLTEKGARLAGWTAAEAKSCPLLISDAKERRIACCRAAGVPFDESPTQAVEVVPTQPDPGCEGGSDDQHPASTTCTRQKRARPDLE